MYGGLSNMSVIAEIKARLDIVDVVSGYANLQKAGRNFKALCPFHQEKTPSFVVFPDSQTWRCFGACGEGGDLFSFVMKAEGWDFREALQELANRAGVELTPRPSDQVERQAEIDRLYGLLEETARFFSEQLFDSPAAQGARRYVEDRHLSPATAEKFVLGYAPDDWRQALEHLQLLGYTQAEIIDAGVAIRNEKGNVYDRFRHRLVIPIRDERGRTVGFGARALEKDAVPKYLNSSQGPLFDKSRLLYGLDMARRAIRESETAVIVEGYMDVMQAHQAGFENVVAQMGTALTEEQLRQLARYARRLVLALDPDEAGLNATMRGLDVARQTLEGDQTVTFDPRGMIRYTGMLDMDIRVASLPTGQDPDDLIREAPDAWQHLVDGAVPVAQYVIERETAHVTEHTSYHEREDIARVLMPILTATENDIHQYGNIQALARRVHIEEETLIQMTQRRRAVQTRALPTVRQQRRLVERSIADFRVSGPPGQSEEREAFCLHLLLQEPERLFDVNRALRELQGDDERLAGVLAPFSTADFSRADYQIIFAHIDQSLRQDTFDTIAYLREHLLPELMEVVEDLQISTLEMFERGLSGALATELKSIIRAQARIRAVPEPDTSSFIQEALCLRHSRLERESRELFFLQQDADMTDQHHHAQINANVRARQLITKSLQRLKALSH
jgi:DNA primase